eukprot:c13615_g1_i2.p1 GENE.c13615_g1_i2~~c13615_g1_i2.p1  ORF type:complete len:150 (+),score=18.53 c13615_g1_i2:266-715(+)
MFASFGIAGVSVGQSMTEMNFLDQTQGVSDSCTCICLPMVPDEETGGIAGTLADLSKNYDQADASATRLVQMGAQGKKQLEEAADELHRQDEDLQKINEGVSNLQMSLSRANTVARRLGRAAKTDPLVWCEAATIFVCVTIIVVYKNLS